METIKNFKSLQEAVASRREFSVNVGIYIESFSPMGEGKLAYIRKHRESNFETSRGIVSSEVVLDVLRLFLD